MSETIRFIDLFGGIGGFRLGLEQASDKFKCVDYIEYDKYAVKSYNEIFKERHEPRDVTQLSTEQIADHNLLCAGFPCQSFSVAGNRQGTDEARGKLFREIVKIAKAKKPKMLLLENVKGILSQKAVQNGESIPKTKGHAFTEVLQALHELGYCLEWQVLNSKHWGVPQNRERVFIIGHLGGEPRRKIFPIRREDREDTGEDELELDYIGSVSDNEWLEEDSDKSRGHRQGNRVYSEKGVAPALSVNKGGASGHSQVIAEDVEKQINSLGNVNPSGRGMNGKVYEASDNTVMPTVNTNKGEGHKILNHQFRPESRPSIEEDGQSGGSRLLYNSDYSYALSSSPHYCVEPVHTPEFAEKDMNMESRVGSEDGSMFTIDGTSQHGIMEDWKPLQRKRTEKAKEIRRKHRQKHGEDYSPMSEYKFGIKDEENVFHTVTAQPEKSHKLKKKKRIRKLTPKECWRLQGFPDESFERAQEVNSDTQLYKQAGNAVTVNVIKALGEEIQVYFGETK